VFVVIGDGFWAQPISVFLGLLVAPSFNRNPLLSPLEIKCILQLSITAYIMPRRSKTNHSFFFHSTAAAGSRSILLLLARRWVKHSLWKKQEHFVSFNFSILNSMQLLAFIKMCALYLCILCMCILLPAHRIEIGSFQNSANTHHGAMHHGTS
jgi:hypothetical protein